MRLVIDTNVMISALLSSGSLPAHLIVLWREGRFELLTSAEQLDDLRRVTRYPKIRVRMPMSLAGRLINELGHVAVVVEELPAVAICADPFDNYLLATAAAGAADFLITGDKRDLLGIGAYGRCRILAVRDFMGTHNRAL
jgi:putative PIN family toxin of toxin-antitoxin system